MRVTGWLWVPTILAVVSPFPFLLGGILDIPWSVQLAGIITFTLMVLTLLIYGVVKNPKN